MVGDHSGGDGDHEVEEQGSKEEGGLARPTGGEADQPTSNAAPDSNKLISFDSITAQTGLDTVTLDDLNDDDFDPRAFDQGNSGDSSDTSDDFNPRGSAALQAGPVIKPAEALHQVGNIHREKSQGSLHLTPLSRLLLQFLLVLPLLPPLPLETQARLLASQSTLPLLPPTLSPHLWHPC